MPTLPPTLGQGQELTASWLNQMRAYCLAITPRPGIGVMLSQTPSGITINAHQSKGSGGMSAIQAGSDAWQCNLDNETGTITIAGSTSNVILLGIDSLIVDTDGIVAALGAGYVLLQVFWSAELQDWDYNYDFVSSLPSEQACQWQFVLAEVTEADGALTLAQGDYNTITCDNAYIRARVVADVAIANGEASTQYLGQAYTYGAVVNPACNCQPSQASSSSSMSYASIAALGYCSSSSAGAP